MNNITSQSSFSENLNIPKISMRQTLIVHTTYFAGSPIGKKYYGMKISCIKDLVALEFYIREIIV